MPSFPPLPSDSQLCVRAGVTPHAWDKVGFHPRRTASARWARAVWLPPAVIVVRTRRPITAHSPPQRR
jgi:hypothetical protein